MSNSFVTENEVFSHLANALRKDVDLRYDLELAFKMLLSRYATSIYENRFIVGGVAERFIAATFLAIGKNVLSYGDLQQGADLQVDDAIFSIKGSFSGSRDIRLINVLGDSELAKWQHATIFIISGKGVGYADPDLLPNCTKRVKDAVVLNLYHVYNLWENEPKLLVNIDIPQSRRDASGSDVASKVVADEILRDSRMKRLRPVLSNPTGDD
ncbi:MAG: hypothetical protein D6712_05385 [Chloroflexi bacterium]|nr:MAG: hypothetical protein D6712_05385 [Chloroflexota bacterium]